MVLDLYRYNFFCWIETKLISTGPFAGLLYELWMIDGDNSEAISGMND
jgi:hypothetical protein